MDIEEEKASNPVAGPACEIHSRSARVPGHLVRRHWRRGFPKTLTSALAVLALAFEFGCAGSVQDPEIPSGAAARAAEIERLEASIARDRKTLEDLITQPEDAARTELHEDPALREIAERLAADSRYLERIQRADPATTEPDARP